MKKSKWKSYRLWVAIAALIGMFLQDCGFIDMVDRYEMYVSIILSILIFLGVIHSPEKEVIREVLEEELNSKEKEPKVDRETIEKVVEELKEKENEDEDQEST
ncbi:MULTISPECIES: hypothetical protein [Pontibacillus]|uniref:Holin n=1 Tax=Pontibacillus chungwhensis TaxID=265426 RepID=A0ABY8V224_9BACI|nr:MULTISPECIES: hypothetical protein [Pontibacillus]MCD5325525.1 hypothetical protein [Pontibacillus sp. HN14]WIF98635.1 hypothetical protein QNI29_02905 [Pontibacillus chungwhensis]